MKVIHIQNSMSVSGNAAYRLSCSMRDNGIESNVLNISSGPNIQNVYLHSRNKQPLLVLILNKINRVCKLHRKKNNSYFYNPLPLIGRCIHKNRLVKEADVIYIHWIAGILSINDLENIINLQKPVIFYMHDMWSFTGGCHHSFSCKQYELDCSDCPMFLRSNSPKNQIENLRKLFSKKRNVAFVSPSRWMADCARNSIVTKGCLVTNIANVVDNKIFRPRDKKQAKIELGLPLDKKIITFGCQAGTNNKYKGWDYLREAIDNLQRDDIHIVIYGTNDDVETRNQINVPLTSLGYINDERKLAKICNATDVFVSPSLAESFGLTFLENILCKTPVVGFNNTAIGEIVQHKKNGYLAKNQDAKDLKDGISYVLNHELFIDVNYYNPQDIINKHSQLMDYLLNNNND